MNLKLLAKKHSKSKHKLANIHIRWERSQSLLSHMVSKKMESLKFKQKIDFIFICINKLITLNKSRFQINIKVDIYTYSIHILQPKNQSTLIVVVDGRVFYF